MGVATNARNLHRRLSASQGYGLPALHLNVRRQIDLSKQRAGDDQTALHRLAVFLEPGEAIHGVAEIRDLTLGVTALARKPGTTPKRSLCRSACFAMASSIAKKQRTHAPFLILLSSVHVTITASPT